VARGRGFFGRIADAVGRVADTLTKPIERLFGGPEEPRPQPPTRRPPPKRGGPPRERERPSRRERERRLRDPWYDGWRDGMGRRGRLKSGHKPSFLDNKDFVQDLARDHDISGEDLQDFWRDYIKYMVRGEGRYRRQDIRNPFWQRWNIHPDTFAWSEWRKAMGYGHASKAA